MNGSVCVLLIFRFFARPIYCTIRFKCANRCATLSTFIASKLRPLLASTVSRPVRLASSMVRAVLPWVTVLPSQFDIVPHLQMLPLLQPTVVEAVAAAEAAHVTLLNPFEYNRFVHMPIKMLGRRWPHHYCWNEKTLNFSFMTYKPLLSVFCCAFLFHGTYHFQHLPLLACISQVLISTGFIEFAFHFTLSP